MCVFPKNFLFAFLFAFALSALSIKTQAAESVPYTCGFSEDELATWSLQDLDGDGKNWHYGNSDVGGYGAASDFSFDNDVNNAMLSPAIALEANSKYILSFKTYTAYYQAENLEVGIGTSTDISTHTIIFSQAVQSYYGKSFEVTLPDLEAGEYYLSFRHSLERGKGMIIVIKDLSLSLSQGGTLKGKVTLGEQSDCSGISVSLKENPEAFSMVTGANGDYEFVKLPAGSYTVVAAHHGYVTKELSTSVEDNQTTTLNFSLSEMPKGSFAGKVTHTDGSPVEGAKVLVKGYDQYTALTDAAGNFNIANVTIHDPAISEYSISVQKNLLDDVTVVSSLSQSDSSKELTIPMTQTAIAPLSISADGSGLVTWKRPAHLREHAYDNGEVEDLLGYDTGTKNNVVGNVFDYPMTLHSVKFYPVALENPAENLTLYVIGMGSDAQPTGTVLYTTVLPYPTEDWCEVTLPSPIRCDNGCTIAIAGDGPFAIARDNNPEVISGPKSFFANFYSAPDSYHYFSELNYNGALLIRTVGENIEDSSENNIEYLVSRHNANDVDNPDAWVSFPATQGYSLTDSDWDSLPQGLYVYTVKAHYTIDDVTSDATASENVEKDMRCNLTLNLTTNSGDPDDAEGALFELYNPGSEPHTATVENGTASLTNLLKGDYSVRITKKGFDTFESTVTLQEDEETLNSSLVQTILPVANIDFVEDSNTLTWDVFADIHENFDGDDFTDFEINAPGELGWNYYDGDMCYTYGFSGITFPGMKAKMAAIIFNGSATTPEMPQATSLSGERALASFDAAATMGSESSEITKYQTNDWFISPELKFHRDFTFSFCARSYAYTEGVLEKIQVGYSTTGMNPEDFTFVSRPIELPTEYDNYEFEIPKEAKYVAINNCTFDGFFLLVDDVTLSTGIKHSGLGESFGAFTGYRVTVDGVNTELSKDVNTLTLTDLEDGPHTASVVKLYASGESAPLSIDFNTTSGVTVINADSAAPVIYYNLQGIEVTNPESGIYIRKQGDKVKQVLIK